MQIVELVQKLERLQREAPPVPVPDYAFTDLHSEVRLSGLFAGQPRLLLIHNMGQGCRYCTLWADGINALLPHLESALAVVLVSKDPPDVQRRFANERGWRFRLASHGGGPFMTEQSPWPPEDNAPGVSVYERRGETLVRLNSAPFGPGDLFCSLWHLLALAGIGTGDFTPQYGYWSRPKPEDMDDGGQDLR